MRSGSDSSPYKADSGGLYSLWEAINCFLSFMVRKGKWWNKTILSRKTRIGDFKKILQNT